MRVEDSIEVAAPRDRVWVLVSGPERYSEFMVGSRWEHVAGEPINLREQFGKDPDVDEVYRHVTGVMQEKLDELASERRLPLVG